MDWTWLPDIGAPFVVIALAVGLLVKVAKAVVKVVFGLVIVLVLLYLATSQGLIDLPFAVPTLSELWERLTASRQ
ncbi:MAG: hypothetical protein LBH76_10920 [Propionibacteriaceae bacterium]|nr:hypothetical protein [Propionibacteriaceae bacterium]